MARRAKREEMESVYTTRPSTLAASGSPIPAHQHLRMSKRMADIRYQRGFARPAAEVYLERLRGMGLVGIVVGPDAEESIRVAAAKVGVASKPETAKPAATKTQE